MKKLFFLLSFCCLFSFVSAETSLATRVEKGVSSNVANHETFLNATKKALASVPAKYKQSMSIKWHDFVPVYKVEHGIAVQEGDGFNYSYTCKVLFLDYNEKDSQGNVTVAIPWDCFNKLENDSREQISSFTFSIDLSQFSNAYNLWNEYPEDVYEYYSDNDCDLKNKATCGLKARKVVTHGYKVWLYTFQMPIHNPEMKKWLKSTITKPVTIENGALATRALWNTSSRVEGSVMR